jgi:hypothetical protein
MHRTWRRPYLDLGLIPAWAVIFGGVAWLGWCAARLGKIIQGHDGAAVITMIPPLAFGLVLTLLAYGRARRAVLLSGSGVRLRWAWRQRTIPWAVITGVTTSPDIDGSGARRHVLVIRQRGSAQLVAPLWLAPGGLLRPRTGLGPTLTARRYFAVVDVLHAELGSRRSEPVKERARQVRARSPRRWLTRQR